MPAPAQTVSLDLMASAVETLRSQYVQLPSLEQERDNLKMFMHLIIIAITDLALEAEADADYLPVPGYLDDDIDRAFHDAIEADEATGGVAYTQASHGTLSHSLQGITR